MSDTALDLDDVAARALASIILEQTANAIDFGGKDADKALTAMSADTGLSLDVVAGILYATSWLAGTGGIEAQAVFAASVALEPDDDETPSDVVIEPTVDEPAETPEPWLTNEPFDVADLLGQSELRAMREQAAASEDYALMVLCDQALIGNMTAWCEVTALAAGGGEHPQQEA